ncbi:20190_t:CDS:1, partial [Gigaspora margarita]
GFISKQNNNTGVIPSVRNTDDTENPELHIIGTVELDTVGTIVCKSGYFTHVDCGRVLSLNDVIISASDIEYSGVVKVDNMGCEGDSGAPVFPVTPEQLPGIFIAGMLTGGIKAEGFCVVVPIEMLITDDIEVLTINNLI